MSTSFSSSGWRDGQKFAQVCISKPMTQLLAVSLVLECSVGFLSCVTFIKVVCGKQPSCIWVLGILYYRARAQYLHLQMTRK